jgi:hypothetical protein
MVRNSALVAVKGIHGVQGRFSQMSEK